MNRQVKKKSDNGGFIRVIAGQWRGRKLPVLNAQGLRPTTDRNKETLFNWLMPYVVDAVCLDGFAGSGGLGFEALSRYARHCTFIEKDKQAAHQINQNLALLKADKDTAQVITGDALSVVFPREQYDLVFIDPPFHQNLVGPFIQRLVSAGVLAEGALIYVETERDADYPLPSDWQQLRHKQGGQWDYRLYQRQESQGQ